MEKIIQIAIDGPSGSGKSTVAQQLAKKINITYVNTGAIFRCFALSIKDKDYNDDEVLKTNLPKALIEMDNEHIYLNKIDVTKEILDVDIADLASYISKNPIARKQYSLQLESLINDKSVILEGRDITTVVLPNTKYKFYLTGDVNVRALRRWEQTGRCKDLEQIKKQIIQRDIQDSTREFAPLTKAPDALEIDSTNLTIDEVVNLIVKSIGGK